MHHRRGYAPTTLQQNLRQTDLSTDIPQLFELFSLLSRRRPIPALFAAEGALALSIVDQPETGRIYCAPGGEAGPFMASLIAYTIHVLPFAHGNP